MKWGFFVFPVSYIIQTFWCAYYIVMVYQKLGKEE